MTVLAMELIGVDRVFNELFQRAGRSFHHFTGGDSLDTVTFPETDLAAIGTGYGFDAVTVRRPADLAGVREWVAGSRGRPLLVDAKIASPRGSWWRRRPASCTSAARPSPPCGL